MRLPRPYKEMRRVIRINREEVEITRPSYKRDSRGGRTDGVPETHTDLLWVFEPNEETAPTEFGVRQDGDLHALGIPPAYESAGNPKLDISFNDVIEHNGNEYTVETVDSLPTQEDAQYVVIYFDKKTN